MLSLLLQQLLFHCISEGMPFVRGQWVGHAKPRTPFQPHLALGPKRMLQIIPAAHSVKVSMQTLHTFHKSNA